MSSILTKPFKRQDKELRCCRLRLGAVIVKSPSILTFPQVSHLNEQDIKLVTSEKGDYLDKVYLT